APGASSTRSRPSGRVTRTDGNNGLASDRFAAPGVTGRNPTAAQTYHDEMAPRSSLPGSSTGASAYSVLAMARTNFCVSSGAPKESNSHGAHSSGSLPDHSSGTLRDAL